METTCYCEPIIQSNSQPTTEIESTEIAELKAQLADALNLLAEYTKKESTDEMEFHIFVYLNTERRLKKVNLDDIYWIKAERNYVSFHLKSGLITSHVTLTKVEDLLPKSRFSRIHKSFIVSNRRVDFVTKMQVGFKLGKETKRLPLGLQFKKSFIESLSPSVLKYSA